MVGNIGPGFAGIAAAQAHVHVTKMTFSHPAVLMILWQGGNGSFLLCCQGPRSSRFFSFGIVNVWPQSRWSMIQKSNEASRQSATSICDICVCPFQIADSSGSWLIHFGTFQNWRTEGWSSEGRPDWDFGVAKRAVCLPCSTRNPSSSGHLFDHQQGGLHRASPAASESYHNPISPEVNTVIICHSSNSFALEIRIHASQPPALAMSSVLRAGPKGCLRRGVWQWKEHHYGLAGAFLWSHCWGRIGEQSRPQESQKKKLWNCIWHPDWFGFQQWFHSHQGDDEPTMQDL